MFSIVSSFAFKVHDSRHTHPPVHPQVCNILVQFVSPWGMKHPFSRFLHNLVVTYLLSEAHSGYDLPWMSHRVFPGIFGGAPRHNAHHNLANCYYQQFFCCIDDLIGATKKAPWISKDTAM